MINFVCIYLQRWYAKPWGNAVWEEQTVLKAKIPAQQVIGLKVEFHKPVNPFCLYSVKSIVSSIPIV